MNGELQQLICSAQRGNLGGNWGVQELQTSKFLKK